MEQPPARPDEPSPEQDRERKVEDHHQRCERARPDVIILRACKNLVGITL